MSIVETTGGLVLGSQEEGVWAFLGVPYAAPPVGHRRYLMPQPVEPWNGVLKATAYAPWLAQRPMRRLIAELLPMHQEQALDGLAVNVWTSDFESADKPVLVWIHGGGYYSGSGNDPLYDGTHLAQQQVVVVTVNYRLGAEGFLNLGEETQGPWAGNVGLADQVSALAWVRDNISAFGGDPDRITVAGESAGSMSIATLLAVPEARPVLQRVICQSGALGMEVPATTSNRIAQRYQELLGVAEGDLVALQEAPIERCLEVQDAMATELATGAFDYGEGTRVSPVLFVPSYGTSLLPRAPLELIRDGSATGLQVLIGNNKDESEIFFWDLPDAVVEQVASRNAAVVLGADVASAMFEPLAAVAPTPRKVWSEFETARQFSLPIRQLALALAETDATVYKYRVDWGSPVYPELGSHHILELPFVFGTTGTTQGRAIVGDGSAGVSDAIQAGWTSFLREGIPRMPAGQAWPAFSGGRPEIVVIDDGDPRVEMDDPRVELADWSQTP